MKKKWFVAMMFHFKEQELDRKDGELFDYVEPFLLEAASLNRESPNISILQKQANIYQHYSNPDIKTRKATTKHAIKFAELVNNIKCSEREASDILIFLNDSLEDILRKELKHQPCEKCGFVSTKRRIVKRNHFPTRMKSLNKAIYKGLSEFGLPMERSYSLPSRFFNRNKRKLELRKFKSVSFSFTDRLASALLKVDPAKFSLTPQVEMLNGCRIYGEFNTGLFMVMYFFTLCFMCIYIYIYILFMH